MTKCFFIEFRILYTIIIIITASDAYIILILHLFYIKIANPVKEL